MSEATPKTFVLDTSVLLEAPHALHAFDEHKIVIPLVVLKELEKKRNDPLLGYNARKALLALEQLRVDNGTGALRAGVVVNERGGTLRIEINHVDMADLPPVIRAENNADARVLAVAAALKASEEDVTLVSKDGPLRVLADVVRVPAEDFRGNQVKDTGYSGIETRQVRQSDIAELYAAKRVPGGDLADELPLNSAVVLRHGSSSVITRVKNSPEGRMLEQVPTDQQAFSVRPRSCEQHVALAHLMDPDISIVSLGGPAGTGKTLLSLAAALEQVLEDDSEMERVVVFRPVVPVGGQDLGFLPGTEAEKMDPWGAAVFDALRSCTTQNVIDHIVERKQLEVLPLTHVRGRTLGPNVIVLVDEAQNLERSTLLTAMTRLGTGSKIVLMHDVAQRDNLHVGRHDGIAAVVEKFKGEELFAHVTLTKSERSPVAALASRLLDEGL